MEKRLKTDPQMSGTAGSRVNLTGLCVPQAVLPEDLRPLVSLEALQGEEVERPAAASRLVLLRPGPGDSQIHKPTQTCGPV